MAYKQTPGRGNGMKTGSGISSALLQKKDPKTEAIKEKQKQTERRVDEAVSKYKSIKKMTGQDLNIERAAAYDSIEAYDKARDKNFNKKDALRAGSKAANTGRRVNDGATRVKRTEVVGNKGYEDKYERVSVTPARQMSKLKSGKSPAKQVSKMPANTMERRRAVAEPASSPKGRNLETNGTKAMPKASKKAPTKMKKC